MRRVRRWLVISVLVGACAGADVRFDPSPSCSWRTERGEVPDDAGRRMLPTPELPVSVSAGHRHACLVRAAGDVLCWGDNSLGQLGPGETPPPGEARRYGELPPTFRLSAGGAHTCADGGGGVYCWGDDSRGQLGPNADGTGEPVLALGLEHPDGSPSSVTSGLLHTCARVGEQAWCWGDNRYGQLGREAADMDPVPAPVEGLGPVHMVVAGAFHTCAVVGEPVSGTFSGGDLWCWGRDEHGELGDGDAGGWRSEPRRVELGPVTSIAAGPAHTCAAGPHTSTHCWGLGARGELGDGSLEDSTTPVHVADDVFGIPFAGGDVSLRRDPDGALAWDAGYGHTCAAIGGVPRCWGANGSGQLGDGTTEDRATPVLSELPANTRVGAAGGSFTCVIDFDNALWCWGDNTYGQLGRAGPGSTVPVVVRPHPTF